jgi:phosphoribosylamine--glycine ligase
VTPPRVLVVGSGGREHALAWRLARDPGTEVLAAPGNAGMSRRFRCVPIPEHDAPGLIGLCRREEIGLVVIGPEAPLAAGLADALTAAGLLAFGPSREAARLESSKWFAKELLCSAGVPTAAASAFTDRAAAAAALARRAPPWVIKADGLAAGKGVRVTADRHEAEEFLAECLEHGRFDAAGRRVVIEEYLEGEEVSIMAVTDGVDGVLLPPARDYKRALDGDRGPNTGGMGAYSPSSAVSDELEREIRAGMILPVLAAMRARGTPYRGVLYCGLMLTAQGPRVLEFNCRFGDPETQVVLPLVQGDLGTLLASAARGALDPAVVARAGGAAVAVALADPGYPDAPSGGGEIRGLEEITSEPDVMVFHAGTAFEAGSWRVRGGRAAHVAARGATRAAARTTVYRALERLSGHGFRFRRDIAAAPEDSALAGASAVRHEAS